MYGAASHRAVQDREIYTRDYFYTEILRRHSVWGNSLEIQECDGLEDIEVYYGSLFVLGEVLFFCTSSVEIQERDSHVLLFGVRLLLRSAP